MDSFGSGLRLFAQNNPTTRTERSPLFTLEFLPIALPSGKLVCQEFSLERTPAGSRVTFMEEIELPYGVIGKLLGLAAERMSAVTVVKMEAKLKELAQA